MKTFVWGEITERT